MKRNLIILGSALFISYPLFSMTIVKQQTKKVVSVELQSTMIQVAQEVEGQTNGAGAASALQSNNVSSAAPALDHVEGAAQPAAAAAASGAVANPTLAPQNQKASNEVVVVQVVQPALAAAAAAAGVYPVLPAKDHKSGAEVREVNPALAVVGAQAAATSASLALAASASVAAGTGTVQREEGGLVTLAPFYFNGACNNASERLKTYAKQREEGVLFLESKAGKEKFEKLKKEYPKMSELVITYVLSRTYDSDKEYKYCDERYYLLDLCHVGFPYLNSENLWITTLKAEYPSMHDIDVSVWVSAMIKRAIMHEFEKEWGARYYRQEFSHCRVWHHSEHWQLTRDTWGNHGSYSTEIKLKYRTQYYYQKMQELWKQTKNSTNPADKQMLNKVVPFKILHPPKKDESSCSIM